MVDWDFDQEIGSLIDWGFSGSSTCWEISWELDRNVVLDKGLVSMALTLGYDQGIVSIQIDTNVGSSSPSYKNNYERCIYFMTRELHLFAILSVLMFVWPFGHNRFVWPYLNTLLLFLRFVPRGIEWCPVHGWFIR